MINNQSTHRPCLPAGRLPPVVVSFRLSPEGRGIGRGVGILVIEGYWDLDIGTL